MSDCKLEWSIILAFPRWNDFMDTIGIKFNYLKKRRMPFFGSEGAVGRGRYFLRGRLLFFLGFLRLLLIQMGQTGFSRAGKMQDLQVLGLAPALMACALKKVVRCFGGLPDSLGVRFQFVFRGDEGYTSEEVGS